MPKTDIHAVTSESTTALCSRLFREYLRAHLGKIVLASICMIFAAAATAANAWLMQPVLDEIFLKKDHRMLLIIPAVVLAISVIKGLSSYGQMVIMKTLGQRIVTDMQIALYRHLLHADIHTFGSESSGRMISRFSNDVQVIRKNLTNALSGLAKELVTLIFLVGVMFYQSAELSFIAFFIFPVAIYPILRLGRRMRKVSEKTQEELGHFTARLDDTFQGIRIVKAYGNEEYEVSRAEKVVERIFQLYTKAIRTESAASPLMEMLAGVAIAAVIWYGGMQVMAGHTTPGAFFSFIAALIMAYKPLKSLSGLNTNIQEGLAAVRRVYSVMDISPTITDSPKAKPLQLKKPELEFKNVSFSYTPSQKALQGISMVLPAGSRTALVGESGAGKSTIMNLLLRFYDPTEGKILIGGQDITQITLESLRQHIAVVTQETTLFDDTVRANICYGKQHATEDEMIEAAYNAAAHDFISTLPDGYDTVIGQRGFRLSGGQRQRIAIARAMLKDAPILLLDEATSSLDTVSEEQVNAAFDRLMKGRTTLVVAHRLSTVIHADAIYVLHGGKIVESGDHKTLLARKGAYSRLCHHQFARNLSEVAGSR